MSWATLASGLYSNIDSKIKTLMTKRFHSCGTCTETEELDSKIRYLEKHILFIVAAKTDFQ